MMTPLYHGVSIRDAAMICGVPEQTIRAWLSRGQVHRSQDGQVDPFTLQEWAETTRDHARAKRRPMFKAKNNPYADPSCTMSEAG